MTGDLAGETQERGQGDMKSESKPDDVSDWFSTEEPTDAVTVKEVLVVLNLEWYIPCLFVSPDCIDCPFFLKEFDSDCGEKDNDKDAANSDEFKEMSKAERFEKLCVLLNKSKFYSNFVQSKMETKDDQYKQFMDEKLQTRKKRKGVSANVEEPSAKRTKKHPTRQHDGLDIPDDQPLLLQGGVMRPYQIKGYLWMATLYENGINGILADEMGLGKTIQTIALFCHLVELGVTGPFLIVAPLSTIENWKREFNRFSPSLPVVLYHGSKEERAEIRRKELSRTKTVTDFGDKRKVRNTFVTSFSVAMNDTPFLKNVQWKYLVIDEGHRLKNMHCRLIRELKQYSCSNKLLLTGTPLQNNLDELWSLLNFIMGEIFDDLRVFKSWFSAKDMDSNESETERIVKQEQQSHILSTLHQILTPFLLRRVKTDVDMNIPPKKEVLVYCPMTEKQKSFYEGTVSKTLHQLLTKDEVGKDNLTNTGRGKRNKIAVDYKEFLNTSQSESDKSVEKSLERLNQYHHQLQQQRVSGSQTGYGSSMSIRDSDLNVNLKNRMMDLRKTTNHPYLIEYPLTEDGIFYKSDEQMIDVCGKLKVLDQMLKELLQRGHKTLLFSQMTRMLDILGDYLNVRGFEFSRLDGSMSMMDRQENIDRFNNDPNVSVFLLSTRAGGLGINLTAADTVIIYDSDWNPQQDLQAQDRAHRIGQTKPVMIYRLVTANTIDEKIVERAAAKRRLEKLIIHKNKFKSQDLTKSMQSISPQELVELLNSKDHSGVVDRKSGTVFTKQELDELLDRSDLAWSNPLKEKTSNAPPIVRRESSKSKVFKVVDTEGISSGLMSVKS